MHYESIEPPLFYVLFFPQYLQVESNRPELRAILCLVPGLCQYCMNSASQFVRNVRKSSSHEIVVRRPG